MQNGNYDHAKKMHQDSIFHNRINHIKIYCLSFLNSKYQLVDLSIKSLKRFRVKYIYNKLNFFNKFEPNHEEIL